MIKGHIVYLYITKKRENNIMCIQLEADSGHMNSRSDFKEKIGGCMQSMGLIALLSLKSTCSNNHGQKSWDTFVFLGHFSNSHRSNPSPHPTNNVGHMYPEFFLSFNFV